MSTNPTSTWEAAQLLKIFLSTVSSPQSLWHESVKAWQSTSTNPTHVLKSFRSYTKAHPSYEGNALLHDLERLTGTKDSQSAKAEVNRKMAKKTRRKNKTKRRAIKAYDIHSPYEQVGFVLGLTAAFDGFVCPQPATAPPIVSSTAALYAAPQFGSLDTVLVRGTFQWHFLQDN
ncbi:unnamed protein product [Alternaria alternata]